MYGRFTTIKFENLILMKYKILISVFNEILALYFSEYMRRVKSCEGRIFTKGEIRRTSHKELTCSTPCFAIICELIQIYN